MASGLLINATTLAIWAHYYRSPNNGMTLVGDDIPFNISKFVDQIPSLLYWVLFLSTAIALVIVGDRRKWHSSKGLFVATVILTCSTIGLFVALVAVHRRNMQFLSIYCNLYEIPSKADTFLREQGKILIDQEDVATRSDYSLKNTFFPQSIMGEDYKANLPYRYNQPLEARLPDGTIAIYDPMDDRKDRRDLRPAPPDGVQTEKTRVGGYIEVSYREGVPDGPYRVFDNDGTRVGERIYSKGRLTVP